MARFKHILFVCTNERDPDDARRDCTFRGGHEILDKLKELVAVNKLKGKVRVTRSGCLDYCAKGCAIAAFSAQGPAPETWYTHVTPADAEELFQSHVLDNRRLERLVEPDKDK
jgi:(2Fe-2S) ferredoxin